MVTDRESAPQRANRDFKDWLRNHIVMQPLSFFVPGVGTMLVTLLSPSNVSIITAALYGFIGGALALGLFYLIVYLVQLIRAPYKQRNEAWRQLDQRPKPIPLQDRGKLLRTIYEAETAAIEFIDCRRQLAKLYEQNPSDIDKNKAAKVLQESQIKYTEALRLLDCEKLVVGDEYEPFINPLIMLMNLGVALWNSTTNTGQDYLSAFETILERYAKEIRNEIDEINQQSLQCGGSQT